MKTLGIIVLWLLALIVLGLFSWGVALYFGWPLWVALTLLVAVLRRKRLLRPADAPLVNWAHWLYILVRWPYIARGVCSAAADTIRPRAVTFKVTPKGVGGIEVLPARLMVPYLVISVACAAAAVVAGSRVARWRPPARHLPPG